MYEQQLYQLLPHDGLPCTRFTSCPTRFFWTLMPLQRYCEIDNLKRFQNPRSLRVFCCFHVGFILLIGLTTASSSGPTSLLVLFTTFRGNLAYSWARFVIRTRVSFYTIGHRRLDFCSSKTSVQTVVIYLHTCFAVTLSFAHLRFDLLFVWFNWICNRHEIY